MRPDYQRELQAHPWHGLSPGDRAPGILSTFIEIVPLDTVKYEIHKESGHLMVDRPQKFSSLCPTLYGFIPRSYCGDRVAAMAASQTGRAGLKGDGDPLDICVFSERTITRGGIIVTAKTVGGLRLIDNDEVDDKIIAVLNGDPVYGDCGDLNDLPTELLDRIRHYFLTYKEMPGGEERRKVEIAAMLDAEQARRLIEESFKDYDDLRREMASPGK